MFPKDSRYAISGLILAALVSLAAAGGFYQQEGGSSGGYPSVATFVSVSANQVGVRDNVVATGSSTNLVGFNNGQYLGTLWGNAVTAWTSLLVGDQGGANLMLRPDGLVGSAGSAITVTTGTISDNLTVGGSASITDNLTIGGGLNVTGTARMSELYVDGQLVTGTPPATPSAGSSGQIQYSGGDNSFRAIPGTGYSSADNSITFPGAVGSTAFDGKRGISFQGNTVAWGDNTLPFVLYVGTDNALHYLANGLDKLVLLGSSSSVYTFNDGSLDNTVFGTSKTAGASITENTTELIIDSPGTSDAAIVTYLPEITKATHVYKLDFKASASNNFQSFMMIDASATQPAVTTWTPFAAANVIRFDWNTEGVNATYAINYTQDNGTAVLYKGLTETPRTSLLQDNVTYRLVLETTVSAWRAYLKSVDETTVYIGDGSWVNWSSTLNNGNRMWFTLGSDRWTDTGYYGSRYARFRRFEVQ